MSSIVKPESSGRSPSSLFTAVAENDYEGMVKIYASQSCRAIASRLAMHQRVDSHRPTAFAEEKRDESSYVPGTDSSFIGSRHTGEFPKGSYASQTLCDLANIIENIERGIYTTSKKSTAEANFCNATKVSSSSMLCSTSIQSQGSVYHDSIPYIPEVFKSLRQKTSESETQRPSRQISNPMQQKGKKRQKNVRQAKIRGRSEVECCLHETSMILSNSRPEPSFAVRQKVSGNKGGQSGEIKNTIIDKRHSEDQDSTSGEHVIFDGAVANSTPIGIGLRRGSGGGSGTILHLACAIDSPFALALLLVMGANVSSYHTAFQRSIFHEAACSNSSECLRLLLEIGEGHYESTKYKLIADNEREGEQKASNIYGVSLFDPWNNNKRSSSKAATEEYRGGKKPVEKPVTEWKDKVGSSFVSTLQIVLQLITKMNSNELSNLDAAQSLLLEIPLTKRSSAFVAASCGIHRLAQDVLAMNAGTSHLDVDSYPGLSLSNIKRNPIYDGHGNTPLHWAAFKNAAACVDLLLSHHADPNAIAGISGWTPLHDAAYSDSADSVKLLISAGADVNAKANSGATPLCFAAQEDAPNAIRLLLHAGADAAARCCEQNDNYNDHHSSRFSGYTPLHYCAHYNAHQAAHVLLEMENQKEKSTKLQEIPDLNEKLSIHIAVCRGSSAVLKELLHSGARLDTTNDLNMTLSPVQSSAHHQEADDLEEMEDYYLTEHENSDAQIVSISAPTIVTPISSPVLQSMIPPEPIASSKPWNCLSQRSIDECNILLRDAELNWTPERHAIFHPRDRFAVLELLRVGKRLEQMNTGIFLELWPLVLSFCGRGWFQPESTHATLESKTTSLNELMDFSLLNE